MNTNDSSLGENIEQEISQEPLFVSLGSTCTTAHTHRECGIRKAAFPFDWIVSLNGEKLIEILEEDFLHFLDSNVLRVLGQALLNDYYYLEFLNEGDWAGADNNIKAFSEKCQRRINRFRQLANYQGKVFFVRTAYPGSLSDPHRIWKVKENIEITYEYAAKLHQALKKCFPKLDFELIIINSYDGSGFSIEEQLSDGILMIRIDGIFESYKDFYFQLLKDKNYTILH
ncbi:MAG TPA: DUF1796 family putative cysteine peptidase [Rhabdochlamydiaceae bacterium]|nr:DUF1796 family putative cysteine peptidase [Rhabdochlamydiaceae bacterium]